MTRYAESLSLSLPWIGIILDPPRLFCRGAAGSLVRDGEAQKINGTKISRNYSKEQRPYKHLSYHPHISAEDKHIKKNDQQQQSTRRVWNTCGVSKVKEYEDGGQTL